MELEVWWTASYNKDMSQQDALTVQKTNRTQGSIRRSVACSWGSSYMDIHDRVSSQPEPSGEITVHLLSDHAKEQKKSKYQKRQQPYF